MINYFKSKFINILLEDISYNLTKNYKNWKHIEHIIFNNLYSPEDYTHYNNSYYYFKWEYEDLYDKYTKSFKEYCKITSIFKLLFVSFYIIDYFCRYRFISKEIKKLNLYLIIKYDN